MRTIQIIAKCNDMCVITFSDSDEKFNFEKTKNGYVPRHLGIGGGDYIRLTIDVDSGEIVGWDYPDNETICQEMDSM